MTEYLDVADFLLIAEAVLGVPAERIADWPGVGRAGSALQAPAASFGGVEFWTVGADLDRFDLITGPATHRKPPQMGRGDLVLFHAVIHVRLFAAAEILDNPQWKRHPVWELRWPWVYACRVDVWVPLIEDGPRTTEIAPKKVIGRLQTRGRLREADSAGVPSAARRSPRTADRSATLSAAGAGTPLTFRVFLVRPRFGFRARFSKTLSMDAQARKRTAPSERKSPVLRGLREAL